jgi:hypothetical protein
VPFFFTLPTIMAQLKIFFKILGRNWEEIGKKKYNQQRNTLFIKKIRGNKI